MSTNRDRPDANADEPSWLTSGIMFAVICSIASLAAVSAVIFLLTHGR
jgi:hypothetical protein